MEIGSGYKNMNNHEYKKLTEFLDLLNEIIKAVEEGKIKSKDLLKELTKLRSEINRLIILNTSISRF